MEENLYGIEETIDGFEAIKAIFAAVKAARQDGSITSVEYFQIAIQVAPTLINAFEGGEKIPKELSDLTEDELTELRERGYGDLIENENALRAVFNLSGLADSIYDWINVEKEAQV